jgi:hypothetical protein
MLHLQRTLLQLRFAVNGLTFRLPNVLSSVDCSRGHVGGQPSVLLFVMFL